MKEKKKNEKETTVKVLNSTTPRAVTNPESGSGFVKNQATTLEAFTNQKNLFTTSTTTKSPLLKNLTLTTGSTSNNDRKFITNAPNFLLPVTTKKTISPEV